MENHKTDYRMEDLMQKVREGRGTDAACMLDYCTQIEEYAERAGDARLLEFSHYYKGRTYYLSNETGKVFDEIGEALGYLEQSGQWELVGSRLQSYGDCIRRQGQSVVCDRVLSGRIKILQKI